MLLRHSRSLRLYFGLYRHQVKTPTSFDINFEISVSSYDGSAGGTGYSLGLSNLAEALKSQSRWSGYAAVCAGVAAILTALALIIASSC